MNAMRWAAKPWPVDAAVTVLVGGAMVAELATHEPAAHEPAATWLAYAWVLVIVVPVTLHRRWPAWATLISAAGIVGYSLGHFVAYPGFAAFALVFLISLHTARRRGVLALAVLTVAMGVALSVQVDATVTMSTWVTTTLALAVAWLAGENVRTLRERTARLEAEREDRAQRAVTAERLRIARELHDVVAHSMSVIAVQAGVAHHVLDSRPELARDALATVETGARAALVEMRWLLGVLRHEDESAASLAPASLLADVPDLISRFRAAGLAVSYVEAAAGQVPEGVSLSAYRIVQEGLTNVLRHGGPAASLAISCPPGLVRVEITDDGPSSPGDSLAGHGLMGMRERVAVFGGEFIAGPRPGGGFAVTATLPYASAINTGGGPTAGGPTPGGPTPGGPTAGGPTLGGPMPGVPTAAGA